MAKLLSAEQAAGILGISARLVRRYCAEGRLGTRVGNSYVITEAEARAFARRARPVGNPNFQPKRKPRKKP